MFLCFKHLPKDLNFLNGIHKDFAAFGSSAVDIESGLLSGRPYGGTAILYNRTVCQLKPVSCNNNRITAGTLNITHNNVQQTLLILAVYMPTEENDEYSDCEFENVCGCIEALISDSDISGFIILGDFNYKPGTVRENSLINIHLKDYNCVAADTKNLSADTFTYISDSHSTTSWLDHILVNSSLLPMLSNYCVHYDYVISDHRPISFVLKVMPVFSQPEQKVRARNQRIVDWKNTSQETINNFVQYLDGLLLTSKSSWPSICCLNECQCSNHLCDIDNYLSMLKSCINEAMYHCIPSRYCHPSDYCINGWNDIVSDKHNSARQAFIEWIYAGKPRIGPEFELMKRTRALFKLALRSCRQKEDQIRCDNLAKEYLTNSQNFWRLVKLTKNGNMTGTVSNIGIANGDDEIRELWKNHFQQLYSLHDNSTLLQEVNSYQNNNNYIVTVDDVIMACKQLKRGKSVGPDSIPAEALMFGGVLLSVHLTLLYNMCIAHRYVPSDLTDTTIIPLVKNKTGDTTDVSNYRAIAISNSLAKLLEIVLLTVFTNQKHYDDNYQFGFKTNHSTTLACSVLKKTVDYYRCNGSHVFVTLLDVSKAFDCINHNILFKKMVSCDFPCNLTQFLAYWYQHQMVNVRWNMSVSASFRMQNGTRQGSILSPFLFAVYVSSVNRTISGSGIGCFIGNIACNVLMYADDIVILSPSHRSHQQLLNICCESFTQLKMNINAKKSVSLNFPPYRSKQRILQSFPTFFIGGSSHKIY